MLVWDDCTTIYPVLSTFCKEGMWRLHSKAREAPGTSKKWKLHCAVKRHQNLQWWSLDLIGHATLERAPESGPDHHANLFMHKEIPPTISVEAILISRYVVLLLVWSVRGAMRHRTSTVSAVFITWASPNNSFVPQLHISCPHILQPHSSPAWESPWALNAGRHIWWSCRVIIKRG